MGAAATGIHWFENTDGKGTFSEQKLITHDSLMGGFATADMDLDGDLDVVASIDADFSFSHSEIGWYENLDGKGTFDDEDGRHVVEDFFGSELFLAEDIDGDRDVDIVTINDFWESNASETMPLLDGDANLNGRVDFHDFLVLANNFSKEDAKFADGDFDGDGRVSFLDFLVLSENFGKTL